MIRSKKILTVLVLVMAVVIGSIPAWAANESNALGVEFTATLNTPSIYVSDTEQTVVVTVKASTEISLDGVGTKDDETSKVLIPEGFSVANIICGNTNITLQVNNDNGKFTSENESTDTFVTTDLLVLTYTIPANTPAGSYELGVTGLEITKDYGDIWENTANATVTLTIEEPTPTPPACTHPNKNYVYVDAAEHSVDCPDCDEVFSNEAHSYSIFTNCCACGDPKTFTIGFNANGGTFPGGQTEFRYDGKYNTTIPEGTIPTPVKDGYDFAGWVNVFGGAPVDLSTYVMNGSVQIAKAQWQENIPAPVYSGWNEIEGDWYYYDPATNEAVKGVARVTYPDGYAPNAEDVAYEGADFIDAETGLFVFDDNGVFQKDLTGIKDGKYVKNGQIVWHYGLVEDGGKYYYFIGDAENGGNKLADDGVVYLIRTNGIEGFTQGAAYVVEGGIPQYKNSGLVEIGGNYYYIRSNGEKVTGTNYWITNTNGLGVVAQEYTFDENGVMQDPVFVAKDATTGIFDGYYYEDGAIKAGAGLIELEDGSIIYVRSNGQVATGSYWATNHNGLLPEGLYEFGTDGKLVK